MKLIGQERRSVALPFIFLLLTIGLLAAVDARGDQVGFTSTPILESVER